MTPSSTPPGLVNSQLVSLPPVGILNLSCSICIIVCYARLIIFIWNLRDINVKYIIIIIIISSSSSSSSSSSTIIVLLL